MNNVGRAQDNGGSRREQVGTIQKISAFTSEKLSLMAVIDHHIRLRLVLQVHLFAATVHPTTFSLYSTFSCHNLSCLTA